MRPGRALALTALAMVLALAAVALALLTAAAVLRRARYAAELDGPYVRVLPGFLTPAQCDRLVAAAEARELAPSEVLGRGVDLRTRVSEQTWFQPDDHPVARLIRDKTRALLESTALAAYDLESIQVARYREGGKYDAHRDGVECELGLLSRTCPADQRLATVLVYLAAPEAGGGTDFPLLGQRVAPRKGTAVFFWVADPATRLQYEKTLHAGLPVERGTKWIANQWVRAPAA